MNMNLRGFARTLVAILLTAVGACRAGGPGLSPFAAETTPAQADSLLARVGYEQNPGGRIPLRDPFRGETGAPVTLGDLTGEMPVVLVLAYYGCPMLCTYVLNGLTQGLDRLSLQPGRDYRVAVVSIDPREGPELAAAKKEAYLGRVGRDKGAAEGWRFLTGPQASITALAQAVGFHYAYDSAAGEFAHPAGVVLLTPAGRISSYLPGVDFQPRDLRLALVEASLGHLGGMADRLFLACYRFNPVTGRYTPYVNGILRLLGGSCLAAFIVAFIFMELRWRRRTASAGARSEEAGGMPERKGIHV